MANTQSREDAYSQFEAWLGEQPYWLQDAAWRIYHGQEIDDKQISIYADMCIAQARQEKPEYKCLSEKEAQASGDNSAISVIKLTSIIGVNALSSDAELHFSKEGITVIYGLNGAGKSGFMRIFKQLSGSPFEEPIQPNIFKKDHSERPSCEMHVLKDGIERQIRFDLSSKSKDSILSCCDVFDTRISNAYITSANNISYQPFVFTVLAELSKVADKISKRLTTYISTIPSASITIPSEFLNNVDTTWIENINSESKIPSQFTHWSEEQEQLITQLPSLLDAEKVNQRLKLLVKRQKIVSSILTDLETASSIIGSQEIYEAHKKYLLAKERLEIAEKLFASSADEYDKVSISISDWKSLWIIAKRYYENYFYKETGKHFGEDGAICPICHQEMSGIISKRVKTIDEYVNGTYSEEYKKASELARQLLEKISMREYSSGQVGQFLADEFGDAEIKTIESIYVVFEGIAKASDEEAAYSQACNLDLASTIRLLCEKKESFDSEISSLTTALEDEERAKKQKQLTNLRYHKWFFENISHFEAAIENMKRKSEISNAKQYLTTNRITMESNRLATALITDAYISRFTSELKMLAPHIRVKLERAPSQKGNSPYKVTLDADTDTKCKPEDILSEGEQRIVALAAFFADATGRKEQTPLIIDDPISSLDYLYEEKATKRIVELAKTRQVIVFTHRISLLVGIKERCEECGVHLDENHIRSSYKGKGAPDFEDVFYGKIPNQLNGLLDRIAQVKKKDRDSEEYLDSIGRICQQFRICVERSVEEVLLFGMVKRFSRRIKTDGLVVKLPKIAASDCDMIDKMMTKYSFMEHSQPTDAPVAYFDIDEIQDDVSNFKKWAQEFKNKTGK